jgi:tripartite-type tricarboxylate transporter receptor subunit TctC
MFLKRTRLLLFVSAAVGFSGWISTAFCQDPFYQGKTITIIAARAPGGAGDARLKALTSVLRKHIPGEPSFLTEYMPAAGGRRAGSHMYKVVKPDGLTIGVMSNGFIPAGHLGDKGALYEIDKFIYLGSYFSSTPLVFISGHGSGFKNLEMLRAEPGVRIGAHPVGHTLYVAGRIFAFVLGLKDPRFIPGYSGADLDIALMNREVDARVTTADTLIKRREWIDNNLVDIHAAIEIPKGQPSSHPRLAAVPDLETFGKSEMERRLVAVYRTFRMVGMPIVLPPDVPKANVQILQDAMRKTLRDPELEANYKKLAGEDVTPLMPEDLERSIRALPREQDLIDFYKKLSGPDALSAR